MQPEGNWITRAPQPAPQGDPARQGAGRGRARHVPVQRGGDPRRRPRPTSPMRLINGRQKYSSIFNYPTLSYADVGVIGWLVDGAAICNQVPLCRSSYGPYARAMIRICKEESFHQRQGYELLLTMMRGTEEATRHGAGRHRPLLVAVADDVRPAGRRLAQHRALDGAGASSGTLTTSCASASSTCRSRRRRSSASRCPTRSCAGTPSAATTTSAQVDWAEFKAVVSGNGPCNAQRLAQRKAAHDEGAWVREAAIAHAAKHQAQGQAADQPERARVSPGDQS